jgi:hypothetical protein
MDYIAKLLASPNRAVESLALRGEAIELTRDPHSAQEVADGQALREYHTRLKQIGAECEEAREANDLATLEKLDQEKEFILGQVREATGGLEGGRPSCPGQRGARRLGSSSAAMLAADSVRKALGRSNPRMESQMPGLFAHLKTCLKQDKTTWAYYPPLPAPNWSL